LNGLSDRHWRAWSRWSPPSLSCSEFGHINSGLSAPATNAQSRKGLRMNRLSRRIAPALALVVCALTVQGCSTHTQQVVDTGVRSFKPISSSARDTCDTQRQIAEHNSVYDTLKAGKQIAYVAPCDRNKPVAKAEPSKVAAHE
jgi:hypothetical protein